MFVELKFAMRTNKRSEEKQREEQGLQIHTSLFPFGSSWVMKRRNRENIVKLSFCLFVQAKNIKEIMQI